MLNTFTMCRDPSMFKEADAFIPERWLRTEAREFSPFTSLPFGFGARSCIGRRVAEKMIHLLVANVSLVMYLETSTYVIISWVRLNFTKRLKIGHYQIENICRRKIKHCKNYNFCL